MEKDKSILKESGILVFSELVKQVPYLVKLQVSTQHRPCLKHVQDVEVYLEVMWGPLLDPNSLIQTASLDVLRFVFLFIHISCA